MRLLSLHIEHFGRLADFSYVFEEPLNIILEENGWGKSTLAVFLKVMFYGFDGENRKNEEGNERLRYRPWGGGVYGGSVIFSKGGRTYRMLRIFGARKKEDTFCLFDEETGLPNSDYTEEIGEELFGIDRESFRRTVFWSQSDHETEATTLIQAKIGDLAAEQDDFPSYDRAMKQLKKEIDRLSPERASGQIRKKEERAAVLEAEASRMPELTRELDRYTAQEQALSAELEEIRGQRQAFTVASTAAIDLKTPEPDPELSMLQAKSDAARDRLEMLGRVKRSTEIQGHRERSEYLRLQDRRRKAEQEADASKHHSAARYRTASVSLSAASVLSCVLFFANKVPLYWYLLPIFLVAAGLFCLYRSRKAEADPELCRQLEELTAEEKERRDSLLSLSRRLSRAKSQILDEEKLYRQYQARIRRKAAQAAPEKDGGTTSDAPSAEEISEHLAPELAQFDHREEECRLRLLEAGRQIEELRLRLSECADAEERLRSTRKELQTLREHYEICIKTASYLEEARSSFTARYMNPFLRSFRKHYGMLTGESAENLQTDADFNISVMSDGLPRSPSLMSEGTRDLISLCRRMAMIDAMYPGEKPFLVLDDPFANLDDERVKGGLRFLRSASYEYQILYLTCHKSRV